MVDIFHHRRDLIIDELNKIEGVKTNIPGGAFYIYPDISFFLGKNYKGKKISNAPELCEFLLEYANVATVPGEAFGTKKHIRLSYAASDEVLIGASNRIHNALDLLK
jgi:aspartate aminotransferase